MGFDFYFAGTQHISSTEVLFDLGANILKSYWNDQNFIKLAIQNKQEGKWAGKLLVDSGAFTCWTKGITICPDEYIQWINENQQFIDYFIQLDCIPGTPDSVPTLEQSKQATEKTWENYLYMLDNVECPEKILPVYHKGEPLSQLKRIIEHKHNGKLIDYVCLGGLAKSRNRNEVKAFLDKCWEVIQASSNPKVKVHYLGCASTKVLEQYPFFSSDATSWIMVGSVGNIITEDGTVCVSNDQQNNFDHIENQHASLKEKILSNCNKWQIEYDYLKSSYRARSIYNIYYLLEWSKNYLYNGPKSFKRNKLF